jgi:F0F1-type ATP synthase assembly protein I
VGGFGLLSFVALGISSIIGGIENLWPLLLSAFLGVPFLILNLKKDARTGYAELLGGSSLAVLPAALATLSGWSSPLALALAAVMLSRTIPTLLFVRYAVRKSKNQQPQRGVPFVAASAASMLLIGLATIALIPRFVALLPILLVARGVVLTAPRGRTHSARWIGITEAVYGVLYVSFAAIGYHQWHKIR